MSVLSMTSERTPARHGLEVAHVADVEADPVVGRTPAHVVLLGLVAAEDPNLGGAGIEQPVHHGLAERSGAARDEEPPVSQCRGVINDHVPTV